MLGFCCQCSAVETFGRVVEFMELFSQQHVDLFFRWWTEMLGGFQIVWKKWSYMFEDLFLTWIDFLSDFLRLVPWDSSPSWPTMGEYVWNFFQASKSRKSKNMIRSLVRTEGSNAEFRVSKMHANKQGARNGATPRFLYIYISPSFGWTMVSFD